MAQDPDRLRELGRKLDETQKRQAARQSPPSGTEIAGRFATELVAGVAVGGGLGWGTDWLFGHFGHPTRPIFLVIFFVLGVAAAIRNIFSAAQRINADLAAKNTEEK